MQKYDKRKEVIEKTIKMMRNRSKKVSNDNLDRT